MLINLNALNNLPGGLDAIGRASLQGGLVLLLVWGIGRLWVRMPAGVRVWMWRIAYFKLLVSLCWAGAVALPLLSPPKCRISSPGISSHAITVTAPKPLNTMPEPPAKTSSSVSPERSDNNSPSHNHAEQNEQGNYAGLLYILWLAGAGWGVVRLLSARVSTGYLQHMCRQVERGEAYTILMDLASQMGIRRLPLLLICDNVSPMLMGVLHPKIVLPTQMIERGTTESLRLVLAHEMAHMQRRDLLWNWLPTLAEILFFFHPLVWVATRELQLAQEIACDEQAVRSTGTEVTDYAKMLVDTAACITHPSRLAPAAVGVSESFKTLSRRLLAMRNHRGATGTQLLIWAVAVLLLGVTLTLWRVASPLPRSGYYGTRLEKLLVSPDGQHVAVHYREDITSQPGKGISAGDIRYNDRVEIRNLATGKIEHWIEYRNGPGIASIAFNQDSRSLLISRDTKWTSFGAPRQRCFRFSLKDGSMKQETSDVYYFWITRNGKTLWTEIPGRCINDGHSSHAYLVERDLSTGKELHRLPALCGRTRGISPDGTRAVTNCYSYILGPGRQIMGEKDVSLIVWNLSSGKQLVKLERPGRYPSYATAFSPDSRLFAASEQDLGSSNATPPVQVWNVKSGKIVRTLSGNTCNMKEVVFSPDGKKLAGVDGDGLVILWDVAHGNADWAWQGEEVRDIAFTPDNKCIIAGADRNTGRSSHPKYVSGTLTVLSVKTGKPVREINP